MPKTPAEGESGAPSALVKRELVRTPLPAPKKTINFDEVECTHTHTREVEC